MLREPEIEQVIADAVSAFTRIGEDPGRASAPVFLFLNRLYEAGLPPDEICKLFQMTPDSLLLRAQLSTPMEAAAKKAFDVLNPVFRQRASPHV